MDVTVVFVGKVEVQQFGMVSFHTRNATVALIFIAIAVPFFWQSEPRGGGRKLTRAKWQLNARDHHVHINASSLLGKHGEQFGPEEIVRVGCCVGVATGYGLSNLIWIDGSKTSIVIIGASHLPTRAAQAIQQHWHAKEGSKSTKVPRLEAIIYTHNPYRYRHNRVDVDSFSGGKTSEKLQRWAHSKTATAMRRSINIMQPVVEHRWTKQHGMFLNKREFINSGIGLPGEKLLPGSMKLLPTNTFDGYREEYNVTVGDRVFTLIHAPGVSKDQV